MVCRKAQEHLRALGHSVTTHVTEWRGHATVLARTAADSGAEVVGAVGGDGTVSEVARGLLGTRAELVVIPAGTGNDLLRALGLPRRPEAAAQTAVRGVSRPLDVWSLNGRPFLNIASVGFDAAVAATLAVTGRRFGGVWDYLIALVATLRRYRPVPLTVTVDEKSYCGPVLLAAIANTSSYGGGMRIAPMARPDDQLLDVVVVEAMPILRFAVQFPRVFCGTHLRDTRVRCLRGRCVRIEGEPGTPIMVDGDVFDGSLPLLLERLPEVVHLRVPST